MFQVKRVFLPLVAVCAFACAAQAQDKYNITANEQAACYGDAVRFCASTYPNEDALISCMKRNATALSDGCAVVFKAGLKRRHLL